MSDEFLVTVLDDGRTVHLRFQPDAVPRSRAPRLPIVGDQMSFAFEGGERVDCVVTSAGTDAEGFLVVCEAG